MEIYDLPAITGWPLRVFLPERAIDYSTFPRLTSDIRPSLPIPTTGPQAASYALARAPSLERLGFPLSRSRAGVGAPPRRSR